MKKKKKSKFFIISITLLVFLLMPIIIGTLLDNKDLSCANSISCIKDLSGEFEEGQTTGVFLGKTVTVPQNLASLPNLNPVLGETTGAKLIKIDLSTQHLYAFEDDRLVYSFLVSTGKWGKTPTGTFSIWIKLRATRMAGGSQALGTYYNLPNVPYTMFFYNNEVPREKGFAIHGAYWHNNFGHPMSHGCVNMRIEDAATLYNWAKPTTIGYSTYATADNPGTRIVIEGVAPNE